MIFNPKYSLKKAIKEAIKFMKEGYKEFRITRYSVGVVIAFLVMFLFGLRWSPEMLLYDMFMIFGSYLIIIYFLGRRRIMIYNSVYRRRKADDD